MKKYLLSSFVIVTFAIYTILERIGSISNSTTSARSINSTTPSVPNNSVHTNNSYKDGQYTGDVTDAFYGNVQVKAIIKNGKLTDVQFLDYPQDRRNSIEINSQAMPLLTQEAIQSQNSNVDIVSGATATSQAFIQSLQSALSQAAQN